MSKSLTDLAGSLVDGETPDWDDLDESAARSLKKIQTLSQAFAKVREGSAWDADPQFNWCHLEVYEQIGSGGFGEVYRAYDPVLRREVALKLRATSAEDVSDQIMIQEARRMARVRHPNVLAVHGSDMDRGRAGIWCDLLKGQTLEQFLVGAGVMDLSDFLDLAIPLASAMTSIHRRGLVHGDIKAANVMLQRDGSPVLMDFGAGADLSNGTSGVTAGSPLTMAPENIEGGLLSTSGDIYSLGVLFFRLLAGRYPIVAEDYQRLAEMHRGEAKINWKGLPKIVVSLLRDMLGREPSDRPGAEQVESALLDIRSRPARQRKTAAWVAVVVALSLGTAAAGLGYFRASESAEEALQAKADSEYSLQFIRSVLSSPRGSQQGKDVRVLDVLDDARRELEFAPPKSERRRAAMSLTLGHTYSLLGQTEVAEGLLEQAVSFYAQSDCRCEELPIGWIFFAGNAVRGGEFDSARSRLAEAEKSIIPELGDADGLRVQLAYARASLLDHMQEADKAIAAYHEALRLSESLEDKGITPANIRLNLAALVMRRDVFEAEKLVRDARAWLLNRVGPKSDFVIKADHNLAVVLIEKGEFEEAEDVLRDGLQIARERTPEGSVGSIALLATLSSLLDRRGEAEEAFELNAQTLELSERFNLGPRRTLTLRLNQAVRLQELGRLAEAEQGYRKTIDEAVALLGPDGTPVLLARSNLADVLLQANKLEQAELAATDAMKENIRVVGEDHLFSLFTMDVLGASLCRQGRCNEALPMLRKAHEKKTKSFGPENPYTYDTAFYLAEALIDTGQPGEARDLLEGVVANRTSDLGADHRKTMAAMALLKRVSGRP